jgi:leucyl/phenylalanyl-tRNA--protein transferase
MIGGRVISVCTQVTFATFSSPMTRPLLWVNPDDPLPPTHLAFRSEEGANGLLAAGADLSVNRLKEAYSKGIFPWFSEGEPVLWWTPSPRMVLMLDEFKISKSLRKSIARFVEDPTIQVTADQDFQAVIQACSEPRPGQGGTWITPAVQKAYCDLHDMGLAHSIEVRRGGRLIGGLYCVSMGRMLFGESMFSREPNASKIALAALVTWGKKQGGSVIDCQQRTDHLVSLGGREIDRQTFEATLRHAKHEPEFDWVHSKISNDDLRGYITWPI